MKLIFSYFKKYLFLVLVIVGLTYVQVQTELSLPDYMSDIVTNGIQYGGITENVPAILTKQDAEEINMFMDNKELLFEHYELVNKDSEVLVKNQVVKFNQDVYYLSEDNIALTSAMQEPLVYAYLAKQAKINVTEENVAVIKDGLKETLASLENNYSSVAKIYIQQLYDDVGVNVQTIQSNYILHVGLIMLGISLLSVAVQLLSTYLATKIAAKIAATMRRDVFEKVESFSSTEFSKFSTSSLITRTGNDITKVQQLCQLMMRMMLMSPIMGITAVFKVLKYPQISWLLLVAISVILGVFTILIIFAIPKFEKIQKFTDKINSVMREFLEGMLVIRAFNSQKIEEEKFDDANTSLSKTELFVSRLINIAMPAMTITMNGLTVLITWFSAKYIDIDVMTIGDMMAFVQYAMHVVMSFMIVTVLFFMIPRSLVSAKRIQEVLNTKNSILDPKDPEVLPETNGKLVFDNVSFKYPGADEYVLKDISFEANPGETVAFIGSTGSGKSTIIKLIPRLFDVSEGKITYCGKDIRDVKQSDLRSRIGFATQKAILFSGSIKSNIEFGRDLNKEQLDEAIKVSQSGNILEEKEDGINSLITQGGTNVSGGQKQRLSIARALAKPESIYIFDDSFSALDYQTDKKLRGELNKLIEKTKSTVFIVAQRISTIKNADKIIVLDEGKIVGMGKHNDLLSSCDIYKQIAYSQLSKEELA